MRQLFAILLTLLSLPALAEVEEFKLDNGLTLLVKEDHRAPVAVSMVWYKVGSADEPAGITGVSHALEHLMFKGTPENPQGVFSRTIAANGGQENAMTNYDYTAYYEKMAASRLEVSFRLEADRMRHLLLKPEDFAKEIKVVQEERRLRTDDNPQALTFERFMSTAHLSPPYQHPVIGWMNDLRHMKVEDLRGWYQRYYAPNNATVVVVGDIKAKEVFQLAKKYFGPLKKSELPELRPLQEPPALGKKTVQVNAVAKLPMLIEGYTVPTVKTAETSYEPYALELIAGILDAGDSGRFARRLIRGKQLAADLDVHYNLYARYQSQFVIYGIPAQGQSIEALQKGIDGEISQLKEKRVEDKELERIKNQIIAQKVFEKDSIFGQAMELGLLETVNVGWRESTQYIDKIKAVTPEQIQKTAEKYFQQTSLTEAELLPMAKGDKQA